MEDNASIGERQTTVLLPYSVYLPVMMRLYDSRVPPFAIQTYGNLSASTGLTQVVAAGAPWVRFQIMWYRIEPTNTTPENYNWADLDASLQAAQAEGVRVLATIEGNPAWAAIKARGPVTSTADLEEFVRAIVARYPQVQYWELYNEPDYIDNAYGFQGDRYAAMLQVIYPAIKAANPNAQVVIGGVALDWLYNPVTREGIFDGQFLPDVLAGCRSRGITCFDWANFHYYFAFRANWESYGRDIIGKANYVRQWLAAYGYNRPLANTETGWPASTALVWGSPELQARYVPKVYARGLAAGLELINWYALLDADDGMPGLLGPGAAPRPSFYTFQTFTSLMHQARYVRTIPASETGSAQIEGYQFSVPGESGYRRVDMYWYDCPSMVTQIKDCSTVAPLYVPAARVAVIDKMGLRTIVNDADDGLRDGRVRIPGGVGSSPIYVDYAP